MYCTFFHTVPMTRTRSRNDKDLRVADHGQWVSTGGGHSSGHAGQPDGVPQSFRQGLSWIIQATISINKVTRNKSQWC